jgi:uncharacterized protein (TIGR02118 family)
MTKMTVIYRTPKDIVSFEDHYFNVHVPLAKQLPGLINYEINDGAIISTTGHADVYRIANLYFASMEAMKSAFASNTGKACAADRKILAPNYESS